MSSSSSGSCAASISGTTRPTVSCGRPTPTYGQGLRLQLSPTAPCRRPGSAEFRVERKEDHERRTTTRDRHAAVPRAGPQTVVSWYANIHLVWQTRDLVLSDR